MQMNVISHSQQHYCLCMTTFWLVIIRSSIFGQEVCWDVSYLLMQTGSNHYCHLHMCIRPCKTERGITLVKQPFNRKINIIQMKIKNTWKQLWMMLNSFFFLWHYFSMHNVLILYYLLVNIKMDNLHFIFIFVLYIYILYIFNLHLL